MPRGIYSRSSPEQRFRDKYVVDTKSGCWIWLGATDHLGYARFWLNGKMIQASYFSYELHAGTKCPKGLCVCHHCDNPPCVNPAHFFLGTHSENMKDKVNKGRQSRMLGETNGRSKLTENQILQIRSDSRSLRETAAKYGVSKSLIGFIRSGKRWNHLEV